MMNRHRFFEVKNLNDFLEYCSYVKVVLYHIDEEDDNKLYIKLLAGRLYWEGWVNKELNEYKDLMQVLTAKGIEVAKAIDIDTLANKFG